MSKKLNSIYANLSSRDWHEHHSVKLSQAKDIFTIRDLKGKDFHLISFRGRCIAFAKQLTLNILVKETQDCQTNFTIYLVGGVCVAVIDIENLQLLSGLAKEQNSCILKRQEDGWTEIIVNIDLPLHSYIYLGCSLGNQSIYEGFDKDQFHLNNSICIDVLEYHKITINDPGFDDIKDFNVVDIGSARGIQGHWESFLYSALKERFNFILFEPSKEEANELRNLYKRFNNVKILEYALGNTNNDSFLNITSFEECSSVKEPDMKIIQKYRVSKLFELKDKIKVDLSRYDSLLKQKLVPIPDFVKIDVQGFEYEVLEGFGQVLTQCIGIELESHFYPIYKDQKLLGDITIFLLRYGFYLRDIRPQLTFDQDLVEVNAFFTKDIHQLTEDARKKLKLIESVLELRKSHVYR